MPAMITALALTGFATVMPYAKTDADQLDPPGWAHHEVIRLARDFGNEKFEVVLDAWSPSTTPDNIGELRFWWVHGDADQRRPFGSKLRKHIEIGFEENAGDDWTVRLQGDRKAFVFDVEVDEKGTAAAFADVETSAGEFVEHCKAERGTFVARRLLGLPIGLKRLEIECTDDAGRTVTGTLPFEKLRRGKTWSND